MNIGKRQEAKEEGSIMDSVLLQVEAVDLVQKRRKVREAAKKVLFIGKSTKRRGGVCRSGDVLYIGLM